MGTIVNPAKLVAFCRNWRRILKSIVRYIQLARLRHWIKNVFVLAPLLFAGKFTDSRSIVDAALAFLAFGFAASAVYVLNDIRDAECDKKHPRKRNRPIASGAIGKTQALAYALALVLAAIIICFERCSWRVGYIVICYIALNVFYTFRGKDIQIVDAFCIACGFVLRVVGGAYAIEVEPTGWILVTTFFLSLFLGFGKRRNEILLLNADSAGHRRSLEGYQPWLLDNAIVSTGTVSIVSYALFTLDHDVIAKFGTDKLFLTIPFVAYGIYRYMHLLLKSSEGDPTEVVTSDKGLIVNGILWLIAAYIIIWLSGGQFR
ncbi:MAG: decaprenyl-phosphate phosphoribosyltransferase [Armatimonadota bacterium]|nr:decaprenyl-phosphate phosphoribosyltransferase [bacterium]